MSIKIKLLGVVFISIFTLSCSEKARDEIKGKFKESYDATFKMTFKASFMKSCFKEGDSKEKEEMCICVLDNLLENYTTEELADSEKISELVKTKLVPMCLNENK